MRIQIINRILIVLIITIYILLFFLVFNNGRWSDGDEVHYLLVTSSILQDFDLVLDNNYENKDYFDHHANEESPHAYIGRFGELRPAHGILTSIILVPGYAISVIVKRLFGFESNRFFLFFPRISILILHIIFSLLLVNFLSNLGFNKIISKLTVLLFLIQLPIVIYSQAIYSDLLASYFIFIGVFGMVLYIKQKRYIWLIMSSIFWGLTIFLHSKLIILTFLLILSGLVYLSYKKRTIKAKWLIIKNQKILFSFIIPWIIFLIGNIVMKFYWFGSFNIDGSENDRGIFRIVSLIENPLRGWLGQWLDIEVGLLWNGSIFALIIVGLFIWVRQQKSSFYLIVPPIIIYMLMSASTKVWDGGFSPPSRHMLFAIPVLLPAISWVLWRSKIIVWLRWLIGVLVIISISLSSLIPFFGRMGLPYSDGYNIYWRTILNYLRLGLVEKYISINFFKPGLYDYLFGILIFVAFITLGLISINKMKGGLSNK